MVAFGSRDPSNRAAFEARWAQILADPSVVKRTIVADGEVAGHIVRWGPPDRLEVGYWLGRTWWGRGIATRALAAFLAEHPERPLHAWVATDNHGSVRVLEKCGFAITGEDREFSHHRGEEVVQHVLTLVGPGGRRSDGDEAPR
jgi:RimJ/RimL family protein N-acetyltransferase